MARKSISISTERRLWAESMGHCMNPKCNIKLLRDDTSIAEKAHIISYADSENNQHDNLILLCANCHTEIDKKKLNKPTIRSWKKQRTETINQNFEMEFHSFPKMQNIVKPILEENKKIYEAYYQNRQRPELWKKFEPTIVVNNEKLCGIFKKNISVFQGTTENTNSNATIAIEFIQHAEEFKATREDEEKIREVLFPEEILSIFGVKAIGKASFVNNVSALQNFIKKLNNNNRFESLNLTSVTSRPSIKYLDEKETSIVLYLDDYPRVQQVYWDNHCYGNKNSDLNLSSLIFFLTWLENNHLRFSFPDIFDLSYIQIKGKCFIKLVYEYCLSRADVEALAPDENLHIVNLHNFNDEHCISKQALELENIFKIKIFTTMNFYRYAHSHLKK